MFTAPGSLQFFLEHSLDFNSHQHYLKKVKCLFKVEVYFTYPGSLEALLSNN